jgi:hypothetical protein
MEYSICVLASTAIVSTYAFALMGFTYPRLPKLVVPNCLVGSSRGRKRRESAAESSSATMAIKRKK